MEGTACKGRGPAGWWKTARVHVELTVHENFGGKYQIRLSPRADCSDTDAAAGYVCFVPCAGADNLPVEINGRAHKSRMQAAIVCDGTRRVWTWDYSEQWALDRVQRGSICLAKPQKMRSGVEIQLSRENDCDDWVITQVRVDLFYVDFISQCHSPAVIPLGIEENNDRPTLFIEREMNARPFITVALDESVALLTFDARNAEEVDKFVLENVLLYQSYLEPAHISEHRLEFYSLFAKQQMRFVQDAERLGTHADIDRLSHCLWRSKFVPAVLAEVDRKALRSLYTGAVSVPLYADELERDLYERMIIDLYACYTHCSHHSILAEHAVAEIERSTHHYASLEDFSQKYDTKKYAAWCILWDRKKNAPHSGGVSGLVGTTKAHICVFNTFQYLHWRSVFSSDSDYVSKHGPSKYVPPVLLSRCSYYGYKQDGLESFGKCTHRNSEYVALCSFLSGGKFCKPPLVVSLSVDKVRRFEACKINPGEAIEELLTKYADYEEDVDEEDMPTGSKNTQDLSGDDYEAPLGSLGVGGADPYKNDLVYFIRKEKATNRNVGVSLSTLSADIDTSSVWVPEDQVVLQTAVASRREIVLDELEEIQDPADNFGYRVSNFTHFQGNKLLLLGTNGEHAKVFDLSGPQLPSKLTITTPYNDRWLENLHIINPNKRILVRYRFRIDNGILNEGFAFFFTEDKTISLLTRNDACVLSGRTACSNLHSLWIAPFDKDDSYTIPRAESVLFTQKNTATLFPLEEGEVTLSGNPKFVLKIKSWPSLKDKEYDPEKADGVRVDAQLVSDTFADTKPLEGVFSSFINNWTKRLERAGSILDAKFYFDLFSVANALSAQYDSAGDDDRVAIVSILHQIGAALSGLPVGALKGYARISPMFDVTQKLPNPAVELYLYYHDGNPVPKSGPEFLSPSETTLWNGRTEFQELPVKETIALNRSTSLDLIGSTAFFSDVENMAYYNVTVGLYLCVHSHEFIKPPASAVRLNNTSSDAPKNFSLNGKTPDQVSFRLPQVKVPAIFCVLRGKLAAFGFHYPGEKVATVFALQYEKEYPLPCNGLLSLAPSVDLVDGLAQDAVYDGRVKPSELQKAFYARLHPLVPLGAAQQWAILPSRWISYVYTITTGDPPALVKSGGGKSPITPPGPVAPADPNGLELRVKGNSFVIYFKGTPVYYVRDATKDDSAPVIGLKAASYFGLTSEESEFVKVTGTSIPGTVKTYFSPKKSSYVFRTLDILLDNDRIIRLNVQNFVLQGESPLVWLDPIGYQQTKDFELKLASGGGTPPPGDFSYLVGRSLMGVVTPAELSVKLDIKEFYVPPVEFLESPTYQIAFSGSDGARYEYLYLGITRSSIPQVNRKPFIKIETRLSDWKISLQPMKEMYTTVANKAFSSTVRVIYCENPADSGTKLPVIARLRERFNDQSGVGMAYKNAGPAFSYIFGMGFSSTSNYIADIQVAERRVIPVHESGFHNSPLDTVIAREGAQFFSLAADITNSFFAAAFEKFAPQFNSTLLAISNTHIGQVIKTPPSGFKWRLIDVTTGKNLIEDTVGSIPAVPSIVKNVEFIGSDLSRAERLLTTLNGIYPDIPTKIDSIGYYRDKSRNYVPLIDFQASTTPNPSPSPPTKTTPWFQTPDGTLYRRLETDKKLTRRVAVFNASLKIYIAEERMEMSVIPNNTPLTPVFDPIIRTTDQNAQFLGIEAAAPTMFYEFEISANNALPRLLFTTHDTKVEMNASGAALAQFGSALYYRRTGLGAVKHRDITAEMDNAGAVLVLYPLLSVEDPVAYTVPGVVKSALLYGTSLKQEATFTVLEVSDADILSTKTLSTLPPNAQYSPTIAIDSYLKTRTQWIYSVISNSLRRIVDIDIPGSSFLVTDFPAPVSSLTERPIVKKVAISQIASSSFISDKQNSSPTLNDAISKVLSGSHYAKFLLPDDDAPKLPPNNAVFAAFFEASGVKPARMAYVMPSGDGITNTVKIESFASVSREKLSAYSKTLSDLVSTPPEILDQVKNINASVVSYDLEGATAKLASGGVPRSLLDLELTPVAPPSIDEQKTMEALATTSSTFLLHLNGDVQILGSRLSGYTDGEWGMWVSYMRDAGGAWTSIFRVLHVKSAAFARISGGRPSITADPALVNAAMEDARKVADNIAEIYPNIILARPAFYEYFGVTDNEIEEDSVFYVVPATQGAIKNHPLGQVAVHVLAFDSKNGALLRYTEGGMRFLPITMIQFLPTTGKTGLSPKALLFIEALLKSPSEISTMQGIELENFAAPEENDGYRVIKEGKRRIDGGGNPGPIYVPSSEGISSGPVNAIVYIRDLPDSENQESLLGTPYNRIPGASFQVSVSIDGIGESRRMIVPTNGQLYNSPSNPIKNENVLTLAFDPNPAIDDMPMSGTIEATIKYNTQERKLRGDYDLRPTLRGPPSARRVLISLIPNNSSAGVLFVIHTYPDNSRLLERCIATLTTAFSEPTA